MDCYSPGQGLMPASFKVRTEYIDGKKENGTEEILDPDFGEAAIGRVAPVDSGILHVLFICVDRFSDICLVVLVCKVLE